MQNQEIIAYFAPVSWKTMQKMFTCHKITDLLGNLKVEKRTKTNCSQEPNQVSASLESLLEVGHSK